MSDIPIETCCLALAMDTAKGQVRRLTARLRRPRLRCLGQGRCEAFTVAARGRKANAALARPPTLAAKESDAWKSMIGSVRSGFDQIAEEATARAPAAKINKTLADTMRNCVACHQTYRIAAEAR